MTSERPGAVVDLEGTALVITIDRPARANAVDIATSVIIGEALERAEADDDVRVVVITGTGDAAFCAGADLTEAAMRGHIFSPPSDRDPRLTTWGFAGWTQHPISKPTIAAVNGAAIGGGMEIALASDLVIAAENAVFGLPEVRNGFVAGAGGTFRLPRQIAPKVAMEMILTGDPIDAARAERLALVNRVVAKGLARDAALELAARIAQNPQEAVRVSKRTAIGLVDGTVPAEDGDWALTYREGKALMDSPHAQERLRAFVKAF
jgi:crotonobetainyl-CoA hydratase